MKRGILFPIVIMLLAAINLTAQFSNAVSPLKPGNKWVYRISYSFGSYNEITAYEVLDSIKVIKEIPFYKLIDESYMAVANNEYFVRYDTSVADSLFKYFKIDPNEGDTWQQYWYNEVWLSNTILDTFKTIVFGNEVMVYVIDRRDSTGFLGSREYWTKEFGRLNGIYEQAEDHLIGCLIDGVVYGDTSTVGINDEEQLPTNLVLYQNYPNPFNSSTVISWQLAVGSNLQLKVYDLLGREIITLINQYHISGKYKTTFDAEGLPSGTYLYRIITDNFSDMRKMLYLK